MKKFYALTSVMVFFLTITTVHSQSVLWGMTSAGGEGNGVIFSINAGSTAVNTGQYNLKSYVGQQPQYVKLLEVSGKLYGMTSTGGNGNGLLFEFDPATGFYTPKILFSGTSGSFMGGSPQGPLMLSSGGKVYGMTRLGGASNEGVIFEYNPATNGYTVLVQFTGAAGAAIGSQPFGMLVETASGRFFGMTKFGGGSGSVFEFAPGTNTITNHVFFTGTTGSFLGSLPNASLIEGTANKLFGTTTTGGTNGLGVIFHLDVSGAPSYSMLAAFSTTTGTGPMGTLLKAANGKLYGTTDLGGASSLGTLYEFNLTGNVLTPLVDFTGSGTGNGGRGQASLIEVSGKIYGTTRQGGTNNAGVLFEYDYVNNVYAKKHEFLSSTGSIPLGTPMLATNGKLYGVTLQGGSNLFGTLYEFNLSTGVHSKKIDFAFSNGSQPNGSLAMGTNNKFYGLNNTGGANNLGTIFEYDYLLGTYTLRASMTAGLSNQSFGSFVLAGNNKLYALTSAGGANGLGAIIEYTQGTTYVKRIDFTGTTGAAIGAQPKGSMTLASAKLYGMTTAGGANGLGAIFEYDYVNNIYTKKLDFTGTTSTVTGSAPEGTMLLASNGKLYGLTRTGGTSDLGVLFEYDNTNNAYLTKVNFNGATLGSNPTGGLIQATNGKIYGTTSTGGSNGFGTLFEFDPSNGAIAVLHHMTSGGGSNPKGGVRQAANGKLYGMTSAGGSNSAGVIFEYNLSTTTYTKLVDFTGTNGSTPVYTQFYEVCKLPDAASAVSTTVTTVCQGASASSAFSIAAITNATSYSWTIPAGASITASTTNTPGIALGGAAAGVYTVEGRGVNVCGTGTQGAVSVTVSASPVIGVQSGSVCQGLSFNLSPSGATTYTVVGGGPTVVSPASTTAYSVNGTNANGCISAVPGTATVTVSPAPLVGVNSGTICAGQSFTLNGTGANTYTYSGGQVVAPANTTTYGVTGTSAAGCVSSNTAVATVTVFNLPSITVNSGTICAGNSFTMVPGGAVTFTYSSGSAVVTPPSNSSFTVTGTSAQGCVSNPGAVSTVTVFARPTVSVNSGTICSGQSFTMTPSGAFSYTVSGGSFVVAPTSNTVYNVTGSSTQGCVSSNTAVASVTVNNLPFISVNSGTICAGSSFVMIPSGASTYTYSSGTATVTPPSSNTFSVTGSSAAGCVSSNTAVSTVTVFNLPSITVNSGTICAGNSFTMVPGGAVSFTYSSGGPVVTPPSNSTFTVTGTSAQGCVSNPGAVSSVTVFARPTVSVNSGTICSGQSFTMSPSGAFSYTVSGGSFVVAPTSNTVYNVTGSSAQGCVSSNTAVASVTVNNLPFITVNSGTICAGSSFVMIPSGATSYTYSSGSATVTPPSSAAFSVTGSSAAGCVSSNTAVSNVTVFAIPVITVNSGSICSGDSFTMTPGGASTYTFSSGSAVVSPPSNANFSVTGTSAQGCISNAPAVSTVVVNPRPTVTANSGTICSGGSFTIVPGGAANYTITGGSAVVSPPLTTTYGIVGQSAQGCLSTNTAVATVTVFNLPVITASSGTICAGNSYTIIPGGASTYTFSSGSAVVSPPTSTSYSVTGTSTAGCVSASPAISNVTVFALPSVSVNSGTVCLGSQFTITPTGALSYTISGGSALVSPTSNTNYSVTGTSTAGCVSSSPAISSVTVIPLPVISATGGAICLGDVFTPTVSGAFTYTYSNGSSTMSPAVTTSYSITGTSAAGCVSGTPAVIIVMVNPLPVLSVSGNTSICTGDATTLTPSGASTYTWSSGSGTTIVVNPTSSTSYTVSGTNTNGCTSSTVTSVTVNPLPTITVNNGVMCPGDVYTITPSGVSSFTVTGGSATVSPNVTTSYTVSGSSMAGCQAAVPAVVTVSIVNVITVTVLGNTKLCEGQSFTLVAQGGNSGYNWSTGSTLQTLTGTPNVTTNYTVVGKSGACKDTAYVTVVVNPLPTITVNSPLTICEQETVKLTASGAVTYTWNAPMQFGANVSVTPTVTTTYTVGGSDANGCPNAMVFTIVVDPCTGLQAGVNKNAIGLFPNPSSGMVFVEVPSPGKAKVYNNLGQLVMEVSLEAGKNILLLDQHTNGLYTVCISVDGRQETRKLIKD
jgi:uncharacterized repeat protein (TIGR03803 family)